MSSRMRYEVLRRDGFRCQLCGATAQDGTTVLEVDHIIPKALGGDDYAGNLQTLCRDCNRGKAASAPDSAQLDELEARRQAREAARADALEEWEAELERCRHRLARGLPWNAVAGDDATLMKWRRWGASWELIDHAIGITAIKWDRTPSYHHDRLPDPMAYATGVIRNLLSDLERGQR